jgi:hypothetical protein
MELRWIIRKTCFLPLPAPILFSKLLQVCDGHTCNKGRKRKKKKEEVRVVKESGKGKEKKKRE